MSCRRRVPGPTGHRHLRAGQGGGNWREVGVGGRASLGRVRPSPRAPVRRGPQGGEFGPSPGSGRRSESDSGSRASDIRGRTELE